MKTPATDPGLVRNVVGPVTIATGLILLIPLAAMQFSDDVVWTVADFVAVGALLFGGGLAVVFFSRKLGRQRVLGIAATLAVMAWVWAELAVGVFTSLGS
jgi:hypothetical protein